MEYSFIVVTSLLLFGTNTGAAECETGWTAYKDELCIQTFPNLLTYDKAKSFCSEQGHGMSKSSLVMVKELEMQNLLVSYTENIFDNLWLGGRFDESSAQFQWDDGEPLTYSNWVEGSLRNDSTSNVCIEIRPINAKSSSAETPGKWTDVNCQKRNLVMCQRPLSWSLQDAINEIVRIRKELEATQEDLRITKQDQAAVNSRVVPIGSIYIEYYGQPSPGTLWPSLAWQDISNTYAGLFFRASGGGAASWGSTQAECAPRITEMDYTSSASSGYEWPLQIPASGWSAYGYAGRQYTTGTLYYEGLQFNTSGCEVRPKNQAIRLWKRTA